MCGCIIFNVYLRIYLSQRTFFFALTLTDKEVILLDTVKTKDPGPYLGKTLLDFTVHAATRRDRKKHESHNGSRTGRGTDLPGHRLQVTVEQQQQL